MQVKIFQAFGKDEITQLEEQINDWLGKELSTLNIRYTDCTAAGVGQTTDEIYQALIISVWYDYSN